tara:strand:- start:173 stop:502 length:330 start_codon:yes stop_codon:yes gene_type:complete
MGSTLEAQKKIVGTASPGKPYYSSKSLGKGYEDRFPSAAYSADIRKRSPFGEASPRAAALDVAAGAVNLFRDKEGRRGARHAETVAKELSDEDYVGRNDGGMAKKTRVF